MSHLPKSLLAKLATVALSTSLLVGCGAPAASPVARSTGLSSHRSVETNKADLASSTSAMFDASGEIAAMDTEEHSWEGPVAGELDTGEWKRPVALSAEPPTTGTRRSESSETAERLPAAPSRSRQYEPVTAGVVDDNEQWQEYLDYLQRHTDAYARPIDVRERILIDVADDQTMPVHDARVEVRQDDQMVFVGRTDASGRLLFHPRAVGSMRLHANGQQAYPYHLIVTKGQSTSNQIFDRQAGNRWSVTLDSPPAIGKTQLDLLFLVDATGSMGDEIAKLKASMADVADEIARLPEQPDVRYGLVAYRDLSDSYVVRNSDFTADLSRFQRSLSRLRADGGGDEPESLNEALNMAVHGMSWRSEDTVRMVVLVADAPPHLDYDWQPFSYETDVVEAVRRGIKLFPVGASGLSVDGEYIFRQLAQFTGGKFVFLTYADGSNPKSGPGVETEHDVANYSVDTLDKLIVQLVQEELAQLPQIAGQQQPFQAMALQ
jgi:Mg-chelatase subunit ChlD